MFYLFSLLFIHQHILPSSDHFQRDQMGLNPTGCEVTNTVCHGEVMIPGYVRVQTLVSLLNTDGKR